MGETISRSPAQRRDLSVALQITALLVLACRTAPPASPTIQVVDDAGRTITLSAPARRVVSLIPATTELLFAFGADSAVVGRSRYCDHPEAAREVFDLGDGIKPSVEAILARNPDLVILYNSGDNAAVATRLQDLGISVLRVNTDQLNDVARLARMLGRLTGRQRAADSLSQAFTLELERATRPSGSEPPEVLILVWEQPPMTVGRGSFLSELVERAGGENLFADVASSSGVISIEAVAQRDPDLILTMAEGPSAFASRPEWQVVPAVRQRRFLRIEGSEFSRPSPRAPAAIRRLGRQLSEAAR